MAIVRVTTTMSLDGFMAGPDDEMDWVFDYAGDIPGDAVQELIDSTGAILAGRGSYNVGRRSTRPASPGSGSMPYKAIPQRTKL